MIRLAQDRDLLVVLDETPRLLADRPDFADLVSAIWEQRVRGHRLMLVLTGSADDYLYAYAACGGYPLHLLRWDQSGSVEDNLIAHVFSPGGLLVRDALDILSEDLDWRGGYERVLAAIGAAMRRRSRIAGRAQQRIDYNLDRLRRAGYVRQVRPIGAPATADPLYEITDDYLAFWFTVLRDDADLIEGGQGLAVRRRVDGRWQRHVGRVFEVAAREHAASLMAAGTLPDDMLIGRWWLDETVDIDVAGLVGDRIALIGECRLQSKPLVSRDLAELRRKAGVVRNLADEPTFAFWSRGGIDPALSGYPDLLSFTLDDMLVQRLGD